VQFSGIVSHWRKINPISWFTTAFLLQVLLKNLDFTGYCSDILMCNGQFQKHFGWIYLFEILNTKISKSRLIFVCLVKKYTVTDEKFGLYRPTKYCLYAVAVITECSMVILVFCEQCARCRRKRNGVVSQ